jgi:hypothetical protein
MKQRILFSALVLAALAGELIAQQAAGQENKPAIKSPDAVAAQRSFDFAAAKAKAEFDKAIKAATAELIAALEASKEKATKAGNLDEAVRLRDRIKELQGPPPAKAAEAKPPTTNPHNSIVGTWVINPGEADSKVYTLEAGGKATRTGTSEYYSHGTWKLDANNNLVITWVSGSSQTFTKREGDQLIGTSDKGSPTVLKPMPAASQPTGKGILE